jgi:glutamine amidotransferase-like uncharacterized protein
MPGVYGETSHYPAEIGEEGLKRIHDFAARGGVVFTICAATYYVSKDTVYEPSWSGRKTHHSLNSLFNAAAKGPVAPYGRQPDTDPKFGDVVVVPVRHKTPNGQWHNARVCYGNGPALFPYDAADPDTDILAVFSEVPGQPAAMIRRQIGKGALYLSGILPEISYQFVQPLASLPQASRLMAELKPHEYSRQALWHNLTSRMNRDIIASSSPAKSPRLPAKAPA